jgi:hypothetical protein
MASTAPLTRVRMSLDSARRDGVSFDQAWRAALAQLNGTERYRWGLPATRGAWERAYHGQGPTVTLADAHQAVSEMASLADEAGAWLVA